MQRVDLLPFDRWLEAEVELRQRLDRRHSAGTHGRLQPPAVAQGDLGRQEPFDGFRCGGPSAVHPGEHAVEGFQGARHLQIRKLGGDALSAGGDVHATPPVSRAYSVKGRRSTSMILDPDGTVASGLSGTGDGMTTDR